MSRQKNGEITSKIGIDVKFQNLTWYIGFLKNLITLLSIFELTLFLQNKFYLFRSLPRQGG